ncbi:hypothetical protein F3Y22_tig00111208pilonHSYRG00296 [Hibiscus syriacus]|uniref:Peptidase A1 domain-containing protein n=1 Tax=Hibiscus syriacus TaxID=106335 RepID=A0A6A2YVY9_HIBSY|nr:hypothetical protein F3Y22_tig00111208pilonHSYRG00296 [Hibiscus syriacus]
MIKVLIFHVVLCSSLHVCFAETVNRSTLHPTAVNSFGSSVYLPVSGNVYPLVYYYVTIEIGNPPMQFQLDIGTGSDLAWVQCYAPCVGCTLPPERRYKPEKNNYVLCKEPICAAVHSPNPPPFKNPTDKCSFQVQYADQVSVSGVVILDAFPLCLVNGTISHPRLDIGLNSSGTHPPPPTVRVIGLSRSPAEVLFKGKPTGIEGLYVILDTGSTYRYLNSGVYGSVVYQIRKDLNGKQVQELQLSPQAYLVVTEQGNVCLGILNGTEVGLGTFNVIGDISLQGKVMKYDNENQRIGWAYEDCTPKFG